MSDKTSERFAEHLLYETPEWVDITQLENMTWLSRKIISILDNFEWPHQDSPDAASLMNYIKKETGINDEEIIINSIINIIKYRRSTTTVWENWKEKRPLVNMKIYNYCTTLIKWYEKVLEEIYSKKEEISDTFKTTEDTNQLSIEFPQED